jgi:hypothetical protein
MVLPKMYFIKSNTELSQIVLSVKSSLFIYEHMAFVIFVSLHYLHILHSFTFPHFCQLTELHFCCISKFLSNLCSFVSLSEYLGQIIGIFVSQYVHVLSVRRSNQLFATWQHCDNGAKFEFHRSNLEKELPSIWCFCTGVCF